MSVKAQKIFEEYTKKVDDFVNFYKNTKEDLPFIIEQIKGLCVSFRNMINGMSGFNLMNYDDYTVLFGMSYDYCTNAIKTVESI